MRGQLLRKKLLLTLKRQDFVKFFLFFENCAKYCLDPEPEPEPEFFQSRSRKPQQIITVPQHRYVTHFGGGGGT
jgi:hypothetical protein